MSLFTLPLPFVCAKEKVRREDLDHHVVVVTIVGEIDLIQFGELPLGIKPGYRDRPLWDPSWNLPPVMYGYDEKERIVYLQFKGMYDMEVLPLILELFKEHEEEDVEDCFLSRWNNFENHRIKLLLILFSVSHIVVLCYPSPDLSSSQIQMLKVMSYLRVKYQNLISKLFAKSDLFGGLWAQHGRLCSPRLLFAFDGSKLVSKDDPKRLETIKKLEHSLEDLIYATLKRCRLVKNISTRAAFSIPPNDEFVYVSLPEDVPIYIGTKMLQQLFEDCLRASRRDSVTEDETKEGDSAENDGGKDEMPRNPVFYDSSSDDEDLCIFRPTKTYHSFLTFLMTHAVAAHREEFYDNMGKYMNSKPYFELPTLRNWQKAVTLLVNDPQVGLTNFDPELMKCLDKCTGIELKISRARCKRMLPLAQAFYQENLPPHYDSVTHERKLKYAVSLFSLHARGPHKKFYVKKLIAECEKIWKNGRQTCPVLSLFLNACAKPIHGSVAHSGLASETDHWNNVRFICACNCGLVQGQRADPFTVKAANLEYYSSVAKDCGCYRLEAVKFPVFQPSSSISMPSKLNYVEYVLVPEEQIPVDSHYQKSEGDSQHQKMFPNLFPGKLWGNEDEACGTNNDNSQSSSYGPPYSYFDSVMLYNVSKHKHLMPQISTTEYLASMLHTESSPGLLPEFSSWALTCKGPSSLYSHNVGLNDQPGFIVGSSYLLPWDVSVRPNDLAWVPLTEENTEKPDGDSEHVKPTKNHLRGSKDLLIVKIFVGMEYECMRGHRFMSSSPGSILKASGSGIVKDNALKITKGNMPLYFPCPCGKQTAQLMRIHVVTPKAPVIVTIDPRVRPAPAPCPTFIPCFQSPIPLSQSAYSVLRLPLVYASENEIYTVPRSVKKLNQGELIGPIFGIKHVPDSI